MTGRTLIAIVATLLVTPTSAVHAASAKPNIVIFLSDDMGWGQLGYQGGKTVPTPSVDRIAREGVKLTQFYVESVCSPTRASLMTGRYPFHNGMEERSHGPDVGGMLSDERTMAQAMQKTGYETAIIGKWHLGSWYKKHLPMQRGFDHQYGHYGALLDSFTHKRDGIFDWHRDEQPSNDEGYSTFLIADEFERLIDKRDKARPFFFYVPFNAVHGPHDAPAEYVAKYRNNKQLAMLECMDVAVGRMVGTLEKQGLLDNTLIVFFNDNGGPKGVGNGPLRGYKGDTYEGGVLAACALRWPGHITPGTTCDVMLHVVDLYPTLVNLAGGSLEQPLPLDGRDAWVTITQAAPTPHEEIVLSVPGYDNSETGPASIRIGDLKLVDKELFDLRKDPYEKTDIAAQHPDQVKVMTDRLAQLATERRSPEPHGRAPGGPLILLGEEENKAIPDWVRQLPQTPDASSKAKKKGKKKA